MNMKELLRQKEMVPYEKEPELNREQRRAIEKHNRRTSKKVKR